VVAAAPVGSIEAAESVERVCDAVLCLHLPGKFRAVGFFYRLFENLPDEHASRVLTHYHRFTPGGRYKYGRGPLLRYGLSL
jgi:predicted phosphoribosyltransferase